MNSHLF